MPWSARRVRAPSQADRMTGERVNMGKPLFFWWWICRAGCTHERVSEEPLGLPSWSSEKCPICGATIFEINMKGPEEGGK
jgi:hypothetical protein